MASPEVLKSAEKHPELDAHFAQLPPPPNGPPGLATERANFAHTMSNFASVYAPADQDVIESEHQAQARDGHAIPVRVFQPATKQREARRALVVYYHGGGWSLGGDTQEGTAYARLFVRKYDVVVVDVEYRLAPEHPFPVPVYDCYDALKWAIEQASSLGADPTAGFIVSGVSAGANLAISMAYLARDEALSPPLTGVLAIIPPLIYPDQQPEQYKEQYVSMKQNCESPILTRAGYQYCLDWYSPDTNSSLWTPFASSHGHGNIPPVFFQVCGMDPLRDDGIIVERALREEGGVKTQLKLYPGVPHVWWVFFPEWEYSRQCVEDSVEGMGWLLRGAK